MLEQSLVDNLLQLGDCLNILFFSIWDVALSSISVQELLVSKLLWKQNPATYSGSGQYCGWGSLLPCIK